MKTEAKTFPIFSMINDFESKSFHIPEIKAQHRSLYFFLLGVLIHRRGANRFEMALDYGMMGAKIGNHRTYIATLKDLEAHGFIKYTPGKNRFTTPIIELHFCKPTVSLLQSYCQSIGISTASYIKARETKEDKEEGSEPPKGDSGGKGTDSQPKWGYDPNAMPDEYNNPVQRSKTRHLDAVRLTRQEHESLVRRYGQGKTDWMIEKLNNHKMSKGEYWYESDYHKILSWVVAAAEKDYRPNTTPVIPMRNLGPDEKDDLFGGRNPNWKG